MNSAIEASHIQPFGVALRYGARPVQGKNTCGATSTHVTQASPILILGDPQN